MAARPAEGDLARLESLGPRNAQLMCGVAGFVGDVGLNDAHLARMCQAIAHRGPDDDGRHVVPGVVGLGFRRLSVIDLAGGHQPLATEDGQVHVTCNGEVYNFRGLRDALRSRGHRFATASDTEVIAHLYEERGPDLLAELHGMFAIALWDAATRTLLLARDRLGVKPLYWAPVPGGLVYGSEPSAILASGLVTAAADPEALAESMVLQYIHPPRTGFRGIRKLAPGERLIYRDGRVDVARWWRLDHPPVPRRVDRGAALDELDGLLRAAVTDRLVADVPVGAFLSGGVDSSLVVGYMAEAAAEVTTFSIDFPLGDFSEGAHARRVSELYGTQHHDFLVEPEMVPAVAAAIRHMGEPYADASAIPTYLLSQLTRRHVTVALSGDGADEAFGGYKRYAVASWADARQRVTTPVALALGRMLPRSVRRRRTRVARALELLARPDEERYATMMSHFTPTELRTLLTPAFAAEAGDLGRAWKILALPALTAPNRYLALDVETYLPGDILPKVDRMSMTHALEVRSPFLDHRVQEWAAQLPGALKLDRGRTKPLLKALARRRGLPDDLVDRRKQGFGVPVGQWFRGELRPWLTDILGDPATEARGITDPAVVRRMVSEHLAGRTDHTTRLWNLVNLELWHRAHGVS